VHRKAGGQVPGLSGHVYKVDFETTLPTWRRNGFVQSGTIIITWSSVRLVASVYSQVDGVCDSDALPSCPDAAGVPADDAAACDSAAEEPAEDEDDESEVVAALSLSSCRQDSRNDEESVSAVWI